MKKTKFLDLIHHSDQVSDQELSELKELENEFPYSQLIHNLVAKASLDNKKPDAKKRLSVAAVYSTDRRILKKFISNNIEFPESEAIQEVEVSDQQLQPSSSQIISRDYDIDVFKLKPSKDRKAVEQLRREVIENLNLLIKYKKETKELFNGKSTKKTVLKKPAKSTAKKKPSVRKSKAETILSKTKTKVNLKTKEPDTKSTKKKSAGSLKKPVSKAKVDKVKSDTKKKTKVDSENDQKQIIDHFIESESEIIINPLKTTEDSQVDLAKESASLDEELISENLAMIFEKQGKSAKAIEIYKKLIWKFPQKKTLFAAQIEKLKKG